MWGTSNTTRFVIDHNIENVPLFVTTFRLFIKLTFQERRKKQRQRRRNVTNAHFYRNSAKKVSHRTNKPKQSDYQSKNLNIKLKYNFKFKFQIQWKTMVFLLYLSRVCISANSWPQKSTAQNKNKNTHTQWKSWTFSMANVLRKRPRKKLENTAVCPCSMYTCLYILVWV